MRLSWLLTDDRLHDMMIQKERLPEMLMLERTVRKVFEHQAAAERYSMAALALHGQVSGPILDQRAGLEANMWLHIAEANKALKKAEGAARFYAELAA